MTTQKEAFDAYCKTLNPLWNAVTSRTYAEQFFYAGRESAQLDNTEKLYEELRSIIDGGSESMTHDDAVQYLKSKLAQQSNEQLEPVAWMHPSGGILRRLSTGLERENYTIPLYTHPPQCNPLTRGQIREIEVDVSLNPSFDYITPAEQLCRAIEAAHGIKGEA